MKLITQRYQVWIQFRLQLREQLGDQAIHPIVQQTIQKVWEQARRSVPSSGIIEEGLLK